MTENSMKKQNVLYAAIGIMTLVITTIGATFAYYTATRSNSNQIKGNMATITFDLAVTKMTTVDETKGGLIPMSNTMVESALEGTDTNNDSTKEICVDNNSNAVCQVYKITVENTSTSAVNLRGAIYFTLGSDAVFTNLYWRQVTDANTLGTNTIYKYATDINTNSTTAEASNATLVSNLTLSPNNNVTGSGSDYIEYYVLIWIRETTLEQNDTDKGTWVMNVNFKDSTGNGVTSTITS